MPLEIAPPEPIETRRPWSGILFLGIFGAFAVAMMSIATRVMLPQRTPADPVLPWFLGFMWLGALAPVFFTIYYAWKALRHGRSTLYLDAPPGIGSWISGQVSAPARIQGKEVFLHVECIKTSRGVDRGSLQKLVQWRASVVIDGSALERKEGRVLIPFAVRLAGTAPPTTPGDDAWVDWLVRVEAELSGIDYEEEFPVPVLATDASVPVPDSAPRAMPELPRERLAERLASTRTVGGVSIIGLPFPRTSVTILSVLAIVAMSAAAPGMPWTSMLDEQGARLGLVLVCGGLAALMLLVVMMTPRRVEIGTATIRLVRGIVGLGFHSTIATGDVIAVEQISPTDPQAVQLYGVQLRMRSGAVHNAAIRLRDPALAQGLVHALESRLPPRAD
jgi:hypothetical protein